MQRFEPERLISEIDDVRLPVECCSQSGREFRSAGKLAGSGHSPTASRPPGSIDSVTIETVGALISGVGIVEFLSLLDDQPLKGHLTGLQAIRIGRRGCASASRRGADHIAAERRVKDKRCGNPGRR